MNARNVCLLVFGHTHNTIRSKDMLPLLPVNKKSLKLWDGLFDLKESSDITVS